MADVLTRAHAADADRIISNLPKYGRGETVWASAFVHKSGENPEPWRRRDARLAPPAPPASPISFRAVNLPAAPGYDPALQRHHVLPRQLLSQRCFGALFERVSRRELGFDDFRHNGLLLPANHAAALRIGLPLHRGPHREYNAMVIERVGQVEAQWASARRHSPHVALGEAVAGLRVLQRALRRRLLHPGLKPLALNRCDPLGQGVDFTHIDAMVEALWPDSNPWAEPPAIAADPIGYATGAIPAPAPNRSRKLVCAC